jgi:serine/threonine-protein kinase
MSLSPGTRFGAYEVAALIGVGGMGEVYRATDPNLKRSVALKVLSESFVGDASRLARLHRDAEILASLNHANVAQIYGLERNAGTTALVMEFIDGHTLANRIGALSLGEALGIAQQIAAALEAAHEQGIVHRDLKPANVKLKPDGTVKVLDFGIAKPLEQRGATGPQPAFTTPAMTEAGVVLGTAEYMSPEQARGKPVDKRADIWAFGCVLYEMLSGRSAFQGETLSDTIAAVLERTPDWTALPAATPPAVRRLLRRCLEKDPKQRLRDIGDARIELEQAARAPAEEGPPDHTARSRRRLQLAATAALAAAVSAGGLWLVLASRNDAPSGDVRVTRLTVDVPPNQVIVPTFDSNLALSPDGTQLAFTPLPGPVYIRRLNGLDTQPLEVSMSPGFRGAPLFSPDGAFVSFIEGNAVFSWSRQFLKAAISGGAAVKLVDYDMFHRGDWGSDGWIYFTASYPGGIVRIRDSGGQIEPVTELDVDGGERSHRFADLLPGGEALIYTVSFEGIDSYNDARIDLWDLTTRERKTLIAGGTSAVYSPSGHIVYAREGTLLAVPFDLGRREVTGQPMEVLDGVMMSGNTGAAHFSLSERGDLAYVPGAAEGGRRTLVWVDRAGNQEPLPLPPASYLYPRIAPDGRSLAVEIEGPNHDFYFYDFERTVLSKVTTDGMSHDPVWSPDGAQLAFRSWQTGGMTMWSMPADRSAPATRLDPSGTRQSPVSFSPDGRFLTFDQKHPETSDDAWVLSLDGSDAPQPVARSRFGEGSSKFSPDGRWVAYASDESGRPEIYVQAFPGPGLKLQISNDGGTDPVWRRAGGELYDRSGNRMMAVSVSTSPQFSASAPRMLWEGPYSSGSGSSCGMPGVASSNYDVTADGDRFLMVRDDDLAVVGTQIVVVLNWAEELKARERARLQVAVAN